MTERLPTDQEDNHQALLPLVLESIKKLARSYKKGQATLQTTEIVHEGYLRLIKEDARKWSDESAYLAAFAVCMRRYLVDRFRSKTAQKRGGQWTDQSLDELSSEFPAPDGFSDWLELDQKLKRLEQIDPLSCQVVQLKFFIGLTIEEMAKVIKKDPSTVSRKWQFARAWLRSELSETT